MRQLVCTLLLLSAATAQDPLLHYAFDRATGGEVANLSARGPARARLEGHAVGGVAPNGTPALLGMRGQRAGGERVATGAFLAIAQEFSVAFAIDTSGVASVHNPFAYVFGHDGGSDLRAFVGGAAGADGLVVRGGGLLPHHVPEGAGRQGPVHVGFVYDGRRGESRGYVNGALVSVQPQPRDLVIVSSGEFLIGAHGGTTDSLAPGSGLDDFRLLDHAVSDRRLALWTLESGLLASFDYQTNTAAARLTLDGQRGSMTTPARTRSVVGEAVRLDLSASATAQAFDLGVSTRPLVPLSGGAVHLHDDVLNLHLGGGSTMWLGSGTGLPSPLPYPGAIRTFPTPRQEIFLSAQAVVLDPSEASGFALSQGVELQVGGDLLDEDFEAATPGLPGALPPGFVHGGGDLPFRVHRGPTPSGSTGPAGDRTTGTGTYVYAEASAPARLGDEFLLELPVLEVSGRSAVTLEFSWHLLGSQAGRFEVQELTPSGWATRFLRTGDQGAAWHDERLRLPVSGARLELRFRYARGVGFAGDLAIDDVRVRP